jgi:hypothetical protein
MRKILTILVAVAAFASLAGVASADAPHRNYNGGYGGPGFVHYFWGCETYQSSGVQGQYGAWGNYIDGCTTARVSCPSYARNCAVTGTSYIDLANHRGDRVTMNSRIWIYNSAGQVRGWADMSCAGYDTCTNTQYGTINPGESITVQCNGVRATNPYNTGIDNCKADLRSQ